MLRSGKYGGRDGVRFLWIEDLARPEHHDQGAVSYIGYVVCPTGHRLNHAGLFGGHDDLVLLTGHDMTKAKAGAPFHHEEFLALRMMVVPSTGDSRMRSEKGKLPTVRGLEHFGKHASRIRVPCQ